MTAYDSSGFAIDRLYAQLRAVHEYHHGREARVVFLSQAIAANDRSGNVVAVRSIGS